ncbi:MAG TPA: phosphate ABC transporter permease PstA [Elusimicrobiota bacterium]|jgi:phosphate transport system permease protein|nr:phosphate ABC transporter permease PstA [Elusimicrobiota bacterium]
MNEAAFVRRKLQGRIMFALCAACAGLAVTVLFLILGYIAYHGFANLNWSFFTRLPKPVGETGGGIANAIVGSAKVVGLGGFIGVPIGVLAGLWLAEFGDNRLGFAVRYAADVLNGVPSIIVGLFAYSLVVIPLKHFSALSGSLALAFIVVPIVLRNTEEFVRLVPHSLREAALALGVPQWKVVLRVILPTASKGILTGALLALSRVAGETAPLIFTAFGNRFWDGGWMQPIATLPMAIFTYAISPYDDWHRQAWAAALVLMLFVLSVNVAARIFLKPSHGDAHG